jgi:hypothetical protein
MSATPAAKTPRASPAQLLKNLALIGASIAFALFLLELLVRGYSAVFMPKMMSLDDRLGWRHSRDVSRSHVSNSGERVLVVQNANGHRGPYRSDAKPAGVFRVLALGDSFTEGSDVDEKDLFSARAESAEPGLEVLNAGVGGYGTVQEYTYLRTEGLRFKPDLVALLLYENDLVDNTMPYYPGFGPRPYAVIRDDSVVIMEPDPTNFRRFIFPAPFRMWLHRHSTLYYLLNSRVYQPVLAKRLREQQDADVARTTRAQRLTIAFAVLERVKKTLDSAGVPLLVVHVPPRDEGRSGTSQTASDVLAFCARAGFNCFSLVDRFHRETTAGRQLYFTRDIHWTKDGHAVVADELVQRVRAIRAATPRATATP